MKYKMIALDMDGTLLNDRKLIPYENKIILKKLHNMGIHIVIATGRTYSFAMDALNDLDFPIIVVSNNGNSLWDPIKNQKLMAKHILPDVLYEIIEEGRRRSLHPILHVDHYEEDCDFIINQESKGPPYQAYLGPFMSRCKRVENFNEYTNPKVMMMCYPGEIDKLERFEKRIQAIFPQKVHTHIALTLKRIGPLLEICTHGGTKWHTVLEYADNHNIKSDEIIAIGDDNNDIVMLSHAGLGIAMANASSNAQKAASLVSPYSNQEAGVAKILSQIYNIEI